MSHYGASIEYVLHSLLWLVDHPEPVSSLDLAELQDIPAAFIAKLLPKLEKAGLLRASEGVLGGYQLAKSAEAISVLSVIDAVEGEKSLFHCQEIRSRCALFDESPPLWATQGVCPIHHVMRRAEQAMRQELAQTSLAELAKSFRNKAPLPFLDATQSWFEARTRTRRTSKVRQQRRTAHRRSASLTGQET